MLEYYFESPTRLRQLRRGPLGKQIDDFAATLRQQGYVCNSGRRILSVTGKFSCFAARTGLDDVGQIDESLVERFINEEVAGDRAFKQANSATRHVLEYLRRRGLIAEVVEAGEEGPFAVLLDRYESHLQDVRGLTATTCKSCIRGARRLLTWFRERHEERPVSKLRGADVLEFITDQVAQHSGGAWRQLLCSQTRRFLRYLCWEEMVEADLDRVVPKVRRWRLDSIPRHLPWEEVRTLVDSIDTTSAEGMRDKAILMLIAALGLRSGEVRTLELGDIVWRAAEIRLPRTKSRKERVLPLPQEVGTALADYVLHGRPPLDLPYVILRHKAPQGPLTGTGATSEIIAKHLRRAGIEAPSRGAHLLRHSLATRMVNTGVPLKDIADLLGHASIDTTAIYTKVNMTNLAAVALPFPGGAA